MTLRYGQCFSMPQLPVAINTIVTGPYCHPIISCIGFSMNHKGQFAGCYVDFFGNSTWDYARSISQRRAAEIRRQGFFGVATAQEAEMAYTGLVDTLKRLEDEFELRE